MGWFERLLLVGLEPTTPASAPAERSPTLRAAAGSVALARPGVGRATSGWPLGIGPELAPFITPDAPPWWDRDAAVSLPTISRARDLICSLVGQLPLGLWVVDTSTVPFVERRIPGPSWFDRPDPDRTRQWLLSWTVDDLYFYGVAHWLVTSRYADSFPSGFQRIPPGDLTESGGVWTITDPLNGQRRSVSPRDIVEFLAPTDGLLAIGWRAISIAMQLDAAADRFAGTEVPSGILEEQDLGQEDLSPDDLTEIAARFHEARMGNTTAAVNRYMRYRESSYDPSTMQLVEGRTYQALELARLGNVPPYLVGAPAGTGMTYLNGQQARQDLVDFGAQPYITTIEQTLSGPNVTPRGQLVRLDLNVWLRNPFTTDGEPSGNDAQITDPSQEPATAPTEVSQ